MSSRDGGDRAPLALIFDFGNVIGHFDYVRSCDRLGASIGLSGRELLDRLIGAGLFRAMDAYERGRMSSGAFVRRLMESGGLIGAVAADEVAEAFADIFEENLGVTRLIPPLKAAGHRLVLGSNTNALHASRFEAQFEGVLAHFDDRILSHRIGHRKPERGFYERCARAAGRDPRDCVFIDDLSENVDGARQAGLGGIRYHDPASLIRALRELGVELPGEPLE